MELAGGRNGGSHWVQRRAGGGKIKMAREDIQTFLKVSVFFLAGRDASRTGDHRHRNYTIRLNANHEFPTRSPSSGEKASHFGRGWNPV